MFQKPAFGATTTAFGMSSTFGSPAASSSSPFGFKPGAATGSFGAPPAFGAPAQPAPATGLFGATNTSGGLFGATAAPTAAPAFGASNAGFGFGNTNTSGGLFNTSGGGLFQPQQSSSTFGAKPAAFGFGAAGAAGAGLFAPPAPQPAVFPPPGGLFAAGSGFGAPAAGGTGHAKYSPLVGTDVVVKGGASQNINIKHHCITCMKEYESKSLEELRFEDYTAGRKGPSAATAAFAFQDNKGLFGAGNTFGATPATSAAPFGGLQPAQTGFGQPSTFSFGGATQANTNTSSLFGAQKPAFGATSTAGTSLFGAPASTQASTFGTNTSTFGFGSNLQNQSTGGLFGAKPAATGFGAPPSSGFGFGGGALFNKPQQTQAPSFGAPQTGVGSMAGGFGASTSTSGLFGAGFGKPAATQPGFGFGNTQPALGLNPGLGGSAFGAAKPASSGFGAGLFPAQPNNTFRSGLDSGLGGGLFGNSTMGQLGGLGANTGGAANLSGAGASGVHAQILALAARPYGDQPLFKDLLPTSSTAEDILKPTNPAAQAAVLARPSAAYRVTSPPALRLAPRPRAHTHDKKSLFDGLEESDASLDDKLSLKPSRKRLVLRHNTTHDTPDTQYRSQEECGRERESERETETSRTPADKENREQTRAQDSERVKRNINFPTSLDMSSERQASWLNSSKSWPEKEPATDEPTPRIYPNLDNDIQNEVSERRSSWLTTKTLRLPAPTGPEAAETSVTELGVRTEREAADTLSLSEEGALPPRAAPRAPHPAGVACSRPGYYTIPSLDDITDYLRADGTCKVPHLTIGRTNYGNVYFDSEIDVAGLDIDSLVHFLNKEIIIYPEDLDKPPVGQGLNRRAVVTLDRVWPTDKTERRPIDDPDRLQKLDYEGRLRRVCDKHDTKFIEYRPLTGSWVFRVEHFSKYGLSDSDEEDPPAVLKRQLQPLQTSAAPAVPKPLVTPSPGLGGLGGLGLSGGGLISSEDTIFAMQQTSINLLSGASKAFEMDTTEENMETHSLYQDHGAFSVKSPTGELARLEQRQSAHVQLMKASLYAEPDVEEDVSVSTGDQLVPRARAPPGSPPRASRRASVEVTAAPDTEELPMKPLIVEPHSIVLRHHRKIPPFRLTIAGRLGASCLADMAVCRARHCRVGWGPAGVVVVVSTRRTMAQLPAQADLSSLSSYVAGRGEDDWSEQVVVQLALGRSGTHFNVAELLGRQLSSLLPFSAQVAGSSPGLRLAPPARERLAALRQLAQDAARYQHCTQPFGVSGAYCLEVWKLCEALWGADLENDGVPGPDAAAAAGRHRALLRWLAAAGADRTDAALAEPAAHEDEDESDGHSGRVWALLLGGRAPAACRLARQHGDLNMAALVAQADGDRAFKSLVSRQLALWRECGASTLVSSRRLDVLALAAGRAPRALRHEHWLLALHATARYLCPQVPTLEQVIRRYESLFVDDPADDPSGNDPGVVDLARLPEREGMRLPLPPYAADYDVSTDCGSAPRALDLRYVLLRARALNARPAPRPAHYSPSPADHSLSFVLGVWLGAVSAESAAGAAAQLEAAGAWQRAVQALCYLQDDVVRGRLIRELVARHAPADDDEDARRRLQLLRDLRVPEHWILLAQADRARYERRALACALRLAEAGRFAAAHEILVDQLLPDAVLSDTVASLAPLLARLAAAAARGHLAGWPRGGLALHHYAHVTHQVRELVSGADASGTALEALRPAIVAACRALDHLPAKTCAHACARAEMGARLLALAAAGGVRAPALALPPDTGAAARGQIAAELAEQAAELCIEPSPISI